MLQRIQTVYLLLAAAASSFVFALPFFKGAASDGASFFADGLFDTQDHVSLMAMATIAILDAVFTIFMFNNRKRQSIFCLMVAAANLLLIAVMLGVLSTQVPISEVLNRFSIGFGSFMPLVATVFALLARKGIEADERLVRSADRLR
jgi:cadmium resistance protein CadD (predicted permease)